LKALNLLYTLSYSLASIRPLLEKLWPRHFRHDRKQSCFQFQGKYFKGPSFRGSDSRISILGDSERRETCKEFCFEPWWSCCVSEPASPSEEGGRPKSPIIQTIKVLIHNPRPGHASAPPAGLLHAAAAVPRGRDASVGNCRAPRKTDRHTGRHTYRTQRKWEKE
jgi:hypothetical protein